MAVTIRRAESDDAHSLVEVARQSIEVTAAPFYDDHQRSVWLATFTEDRMQHFIQACEAFVALDGSAIAGFSGLVGRPDGDGEIEFLHVRPSFAGRGVARRLIETVEGAARRRSLPRLWADASLLARPVLEHLGYEVVETYQKEVRGAVFDNAWLRTSLSEATSATRDALRPVP